MYLQCRARRGPSKCESQFRESRRPKFASSGPFAMSFPDRSSFRSFFDSPILDLQNIFQFFSPEMQGCHSRRPTGRGPLRHLACLFVCLFVCPGPAGQTAERSATKFGMLKLIPTGYDAIPKNSGIDIPFSRKREKSIFEATVPPLGAIFSRMKTDIKKVARAIFLNIISFR